MNNISWFIYFAEAAEKTMVFSLILSIVFIVIYGMHYVIVSCENDPTPPKTLLYLSLSLFLLFIVTPPKQTIYMIAASEISYSVVTSPEGRQLMGEVKDTVLHYLKEARTP